MVEIKQQLVPTHLRKSTYGTGNPVKKMVIHQTGNTRKGANAKMHANLQSRGYSASWHIQSDDKEIIQSWPFNYRLWHASTGNAPNGGNMVGIGWEICINEDGNYLKSLEIAAKGIAKVMKQEGIPMSQLTTHNAEDPKNKWCPAQILSGKEGVNWNDFKAMVQKAYDGQPVDSSKPVSLSKPSSPKKTVAELAQEVLAGKWGNGDERKRRLEAAGYNYNSVQSEVDKRASKPSSPSKPKLKSNNVIAQEVLAGKWGNGDERKRRLEAAGYNYQAIQDIVNKGTPSKPSAPKPAASVGGVGSKVTLKSNASKYATGENIPSSVKGKTYTIQQKGTRNGKKQVLLKEIVSWVWESDLAGGSNNTSTPARKSVNVGSRVKLKSSASKYATGQNIPSSVKNKTYTVQQKRTRNGRAEVLLKEIMSWVFQSDVQ